MTMEPANIPLATTASHFDVLFEQSLRMKAEAECCAMRAERDAAIAERDAAIAKSSKQDEVIARQALQIEKLRRHIHGRRSEHSRYLFDQAELPFLFPAAANDDAPVEKDPGQDQDEGQPEARKRRRTAPRKDRGKPWPDDIEVEDRRLPAPEVCPHCGGTHLRYRGEDVTETLEVIPKKYKKIRTIREVVTCSECEKWTQTPAPYYPTPRGHYGPSLLAMILVDKYYYHIPLHRQNKRFASEDITIPVQTLADQVGHCVATLMPLFELIQAYVFSAERLHADDTTIPIRAKGQCWKGRIWVYARDDQPFGGLDPPAAVYYASRDRRGEHPMRHFGNYGGIVQMDCYSGFVALSDPKRKEIVITPAFCWAHARRHFFELADIQQRARKISEKKGNPKPISPIALEAVRRIDELFKIERDINGRTSDERREVRQESSKPLLEDLHAWMIEQRKTLSSSSEVRGAMDYMLVRWEGFARYLEDGRICMTNNAAERGVRGVAVGRRNWTFAGSERGADRAAFVISLLNTAALNGVDPQRWLADVLARISDMPMSRLHELLPWEWKRLREAPADAERAAAEEAFAA